MAEKIWDYIIIGGGSAGCVLANRLSANQSHKVLLLDAGVHDRAPSLHIPAGMMSAIANDKYNWKYAAAPDASRSGLVDFWSAGKAIGGGSAINGMFYIRGHRSDFDGWAQSGCDGWDYQSVLPHFKSIENFEGGTNEFRNNTGPLAVSFERYHLGVVDRFIKAAVDAGHIFNSDYNGQFQSGAGYAQASQKNGRRHSSASAFLKPVRNRENLEISVKSQVKRILIEDGHATGVSYRKNGTDRMARCKGEIILSAGALASPKILMHSGIGPAELLSEHGIQIIHHSPQVGQNLMEHPAVYLTAKTKTKSLNAGAKPHKLPFVLANWLFRGKGPASSAAASAQVLCRSRPELVAPDIQLLLTPAIFSYDLEKKKAVVLKDNGISIAALALHPTSRGRVIITSKDPLSAPFIEHELLGTQEDIACLTHAAKKAAEILSNSHLSDAVTALDPNLAPTSPDAQFEEYVKTTAFRGDHASGTCRMGRDDAAVLDPKLRVNGVTGLRVVDASIMPKIPSGNTNAPTLMIAEKAASMILAG